MSRMSARSYGGDSVPPTPIPDGMDDKMLTEFHAKNNILSAMRKKALSRMKKFNSQKLDYTDWYKRQSASFVDSLKVIQAMVPTLVPAEITTINEFKQTVHMAQKMIQQNRRIPNYEKLEQFLVFWQDYCKAKEEMDAVIRECHDFLCTIAVLRNPEVRSDMVRMYNDLNEKFSEEFRFSDCHNEKDNLFTYGQSVSEQRFLGLVGYIPFLLSASAKVCWAASRIYIEKP